MQNLTPVLERFGLSALRDAQKPVIQAAIDGQDILAVLPTGGGKSLCYQLPAISAAGVTLIISPLLALMRDQIQKLHALELPVFHISSAQDDEENWANLAQLRAHNHGLFYLSPEQLAKDSLQMLLQDLDLERLVIDEAHCFSEWGHDFRPDYRAIAKVLERYPRLKLSAFTATATQFVIEDLKRNLFVGRAPDCFVSSPRRDNIEIKFLRKSKPRAQLLAHLNHEPMIVYAATRAKTQVLAQAIGEAGYRAEYYHAGMENASRRAVEARFIVGETPCIVATNAFGMGVDHSGIRTIIHADMPPSTEAFLQEIGRAGRDGNAARAICLFGDEDYQIRKEQIETSVSQEKRRAFKLALLDAFYDMAALDADWGEIENYFLQDFEMDWQKGSMLDDADRLKNWRYGAAQRAKIPPYWVLPDDVLARISAVQPQNLDELARIEGMGEARLRKYAPEILTALGVRLAQNTKARRDIALLGQGDLYERLKYCALALRLGEAGTEKPVDCPAPVLARIVKIRPQNIEQLARIQGMNAVRLARFGDAFLLEILDEAD